MAYPVKRYASTNELHTHGPNLYNKSASCCKQTVFIPVTTQSCSIFEIRRQNMQRNIRLTLLLILSFPTFAFFLTSFTVHPIHIRPQCLVMFFIKVTCISPYQQGFLQSVNESVPEYPTKQYAKKIKNKYTKSWIKF